MAEEQKISSGVVAWLPAIQRAVLTSATRITDAFPTTRE